MIPRQSRVCRGGGRRSTRLSFKYLAFHNKKSTAHNIEPTALFLLPYYEEEEFSRCGEEKNGQKIFKKIRWKDSQRCISL